MAFETLIVGTLLPDWPEVPKDARAAASAHTVAWVKRAIRAAPLHVRLGVLGLSLVLGAALRLRLLGVADERERSARAEAVHHLFGSLPGPAAAVIRLYRSTTLLAWFEHPAIAARLVPAPHVAEARP
jgi:hypothetical protein